MLMLLNPSTLECVEMRSAPSASLHLPGRISPRGVIPHSRQLDEPFLLDDSQIAHERFCRLEDLVEDDPSGRGLSREHDRGWVDM